MKVTRKYDETQDKVFVHVPLEGETVEELRDALGLVVMTAAFPDRLLKRPDARFDELERAFTSRFEFLFDPSDGPQLSEQQFFELCAGHESLHHRMDRYIQFVRGRHERLGLDYLWHDEVHPAGCYALAPLVMADPGHVDDLADYLLETDLDEETIQSNLVRLAFTKYGWNDATRHLLALRLATSHGQWSQEDLCFAVEHCQLLESFEDDESFDHFLDMIVKASRRAGTGPSLSLGTLIFVFGRGRHDQWQHWAARSMEAHTRELVLVEPGSRYGELYKASLPDEELSPELWDKID